MRRIILSSVACMAVPHFSALSRKRHDLRKNVTKHKINVLNLSTVLVFKIYHFKKNSAIYRHKCTYVFI